MQDDAEKDEAQSRAERELPDAQRARLRTESTADYLKRTSAGSAPKGGGNARMAALLSGAVPYDEKNYAHKRMVEASDRFVRSVANRRAGGASAGASMEKARGDYWEARSTEDSDIEGVLGPCRGTGCGKFHQESKQHCGGGSCSSAPVKSFGGTARGMDSPALPTTTAKKAGPEAKVPQVDLGFGSTRGFREIK